MLIGTIRKLYAITWSVVTPQGNFKIHTQEQKRLCKSMSDECEMSAFEGEEVTFFPVEDIAPPKGFKGWVEQGTIKILPPL